MWLIVIHFHPHRMALSTTKETTNFARICRLLVDGGALALRNVFDGIHPPVNLQAVLSGCSPTLQNLKKKGILNNSQWKLLFPTPPACADSSNFDITLLVLLLRNICGLPTPAKGWNDLPLATDTNVQDDIARIKFYRNSIFAHAPKASLTDLDFSSYWTEIRDALVRLGVKVTDIDQLKDTSVDLEAERCIKALEQWCLHEQNIEEIKKLSKNVEGVKEDVTRGVKRMSDGFEGVAHKFRMIHGKMEGIGERVEGVSGKLEEVKEEIRAEISSRLEEVKADMSGKMEEVLQEVKDQRTASSSSEG